ncbi:MarR family transcriptional regulator, partial [Acinetobacter baumannii]
GLVVEQPSTIHGNTFKLGNDTSVGLVLKFPSKKFLLPEIYGQTSKNSLPLLVKNFNYTSKNFLPLLVKIFNTQSITIKNNSQSNKKINKKRESVSEKPKTEKPNEFNPRSVELPACVDSELWNNFVDMRISIKKPLSENAVKLILKKLISFGPLANQSLENSIIGNYQGVF